MLSNNAFNSNAAPRATVEDSWKARRNEAPEILNRREAAAFLRVCPRSLDKFVHQRLIPVARLGKRVVFRRSSLLAAVARVEV